MNLANPKKENFFFKLLRPAHMSFPTCPKDSFGDWESRILWKEKMDARFLRRMTDPPAQGAAVSKISPTFLRNSVRQRSNPHALQNNFLRQHVPADSGMTISRKKDRKF